MKRFEINRALREMEDIINRGGGNALIRVYNSTADGAFADSEVTVHGGERSFAVPAGTQIQAAARREHDGTPLTVP